MKNKVLWMVMLMVVLSVVSSNARAVWDPDVNDLLLNLNFAIYSNPNHDTNDAERGFVKGELFDYNTAPDCCNVFETNGKIGVDANFANRFDSNTDGSQGDCAIICPNALNIDGALNTPDPCLVTLGLPSLKRTWALWVYYPNSTSIGGTLIRHQNWDTVSYDHAWWEIRISGGRLQFYQNNNDLEQGSSIKMQTVAPGVDYLGYNEWHHVAMVIDRNAETGPESNCAIYVDGLTQPVTFSSYHPTRDASIDTGDYYAADSSPLHIGAGSAEFDGRLDEIRLYSKALSAVEVSQLYQKQNATGNPIALLPIPRSSGAPVTTDLTWIKTTGTNQQVYFSNVFADVNLISAGAKVFEGTTEIVYNSALNDGNDLIPATTYYWRVRTYAAPFWANGPIWSFTTEPAEASDPTPADGADYVDGTWKVADVNLSWIGPSTATDYTVYFSTDEGLIDGGDLSARKNVGLEVTETNVVAPERNRECYWRVDCNLPTGMVTGPTWTFRTRPYEIIINTNTDPAGFTEFDHVFPANSIQVHGDGWYALRADGNSSNQPSEVNVTGNWDGEVLVFDFNTFSFDRRFDIVVIPQYRGKDVNEYTEPRPVAIHVNNGGNFYFDGRMNISGADVAFADSSDTELIARCGGFPGPKRNQEASSFPDATTPISDYWTAYRASAGNYTRFGTLTSAKDVFVPTALALSVWGPGQPVNPPYKGGSGGGYGGRGGSCGRAYASGILGGISYGDEEIPVPFGGSSGGWGGSDSPGGCPGGGGIEIYAAGSVTLDANSVINANGGASTDLNGYEYANGGGAGGSVRIIGDDVTLNGAITADGGKGGNVTSGGENNDSGGGGAGGRIAVFYDSSYTKAGTLSAKGGARGVMTPPTNTGIAQDGEDGTILETPGSPKKASAPTPRDGDRKVYAASGGKAITLKWYAGFGAASDVVYFGTSEAEVDDMNDNNKVGAAVTTPTTHGERSATQTVTINPGNTYYVKVKTDGSVESDLWSFTTVDWECVYTAFATPYVKGPSWDTNEDCVVNFEDLAFYAQGWSNPDFGTLNLGYESDGTGDNPQSTLDKFANEWLTCAGRFDGATNKCGGWVTTW